MESRKTKKVIVISHERSGTHFLMDTIALNFGYVGDFDERGAARWIDLDGRGINFADPVEMRGFLRQSQWSRR